MYYIKWYVLLSELKKIKSVETTGNIGLEKKIKKLPTFTWHKRNLQKSLVKLNLDAIKKIIEYKISI